MMLRTILAVCAAALVVGAFLPSVEDSDARHEDKVTPGEPGYENSDRPSISASGRFIAFASDSGNFTHADNATSDVFVRDRKRNRTSLVSHATGLNGKGFKYADQPAISANGRYVVFTTYEAYGFQCVSKSCTNIYRRDLKTHRTVLVSRADGVHGRPAEHATHPAISTTGRYVVFLSRGNSTPFGLIGERTGDVLLRDLKKNKTTLVSRVGGHDGVPMKPGKETAWGDDIRPSVSANGRFVAFSSNAPNVGIKRKGRSNIFVRDLKMGRTTLVSRTDGPTGAPARSATEPRISSNGRSVAFTSKSDVFVRDLKREKTYLISRRGKGRLSRKGKASWPTISRNGSRIAFAFKPKNKRGLNIPQIYLADRKRGKISLITKRAGKHGKPFRYGAPDEPVISDSGRIVAFSRSRNWALRHAFGQEAKQFEVIMRQIYSHSVRYSTTRMISCASGGCRARGIFGITAGEGSLEEVENEYYTHDDMFIEDEAGTEYEDL